MRIAIRERHCRINLRTKGFVACQKPLFVQHRSQSYSAQASSGVQQKLSSTLFLHVACLRNENEFVGIEEDAGKLVPVSLFNKRFGRVNFLV